MASSNDNAADQQITCQFCDATMVFGAATPAFDEGPEAMTPIAVVEMVAAQVGWTQNASGWNCGAHGLRAT